MDAKVKGKQQKAQHTEIPVSFYSAHHQPGKHWPSWVGFWLACMPKHGVTSCSTVSAQAHFGTAHFDCLHTSRTPHVFTLVMKIVHWTFTQFSRQKVSKCLCGRWSIVSHLLLPPSFYFLSFAKITAQEKGGSLTCCTLLHLTGSTMLM